MRAEGRNPDPAPPEPRPVCARQTQGVDAPGIARDATLPWRRLYRLLLPGLLLLAMAHLAAPGVTAEEATAPVVDAGGREVTLPAPARRIVALAPHIVENLYSIGAGTRIVGAVDYSDFPAEARNLPRVGGVAGISVERIVALNPDLVIGWLSGTDSRVVAALEGLAIPYYLDEIRSLEDLGRSLAHLGVMTGEMEKASLARAGLRKALMENAPRRDERRPSVFLQLWDQPLQSVGTQHLLTDVIDRCGGRSITAAVPGLAPRIEIEAVLAADPDIIIVESPEQARHWERFPDLNALRDERVYAISPDLLHRPTLRLLEGMDVICSRIEDARDVDARVPGRGQNRSSHGSDRGPTALPGPETRFPSG